MEKEQYRSVIRFLFLKGKLRNESKERWDAAPENKRNCETTSEQCLTLFERNPKDFLRRFLTVDETWIHWYTQWTLPGEQA
ncbi:GL14113 [Drosophila persimilis]|uniref:GL14113 n=1 Tax=Drosophila persimilis TaxID=7234 RepID=B4H8B0_DROPE|nr:GL14113 [Drosophila persimilis]